MQNDRVDFLKKVADINCQIIQFALNEKTVNGKKPPLPDLIHVPKLG